MGRLSELTVATGAEKPAGSVSAFVENMRVYVRLAGLVDFEKEAARTAKALAKAEKDLASVQRVLGNPGFMAKATDEVIAEKRAKLEELTASISLMKAQIQDFS